MYGKMTTSRMGIIGNRLVSDFSFDVSIKIQAGGKPGTEASGAYSTLPRLFQ